MILPQRQKNLGVHSTLFGLLLFVVANLNEVNLSEGCQPKRRYTVHLVNETDTPADTAKLNSSIINALEEALPGGLCSPTIKIFNQSDQPKGLTIAELELSVSKNDSFETFEDLLLKGMNYTLENRTLTMMPYSRVFVARFNITNPDDANDTYIEQAITEGLKEETVIVTFITDGSELKTFRLWLNRSGSFYPVEALKILIDAIENSTLNSVVVSKDSFKAYMIYPLIKTRDFRVEFDYSMMECDQSSMSNTNSQEYSSTKEDVEKILNEKYKVLQNLSSVAVTDIKCKSSVVRDSSTFARITAVLKLHRSSKKTPNEIGEALQSCPTSNTNVSNVQVTLLTPQSFEDVTETKIICPSTTTLKPTTLKTQSDTTLHPSEPSTSRPSMGKTPRAFVRLRLAITWSQFCTKLEDSLKQNIAKNVYDKKGNVVSPDRVMFINSRKNCADPLKENELVDLWFYIAERSGTDRPSTCVTLKAQRVLRMMVNNGNTKMLGTDFAGKVISASLAGCDAQKIDKKDEDMSWTVLIIIAVIVGALLLILACCCICCGAARRRRRRRYEDKQMELIIVDGAHVQANGEETGVSSLGGKDGDQGKKGGKRDGKGARHGHRGGRTAGMYGGISDTDSDDYYDCCGVGIAGAHGGKKTRDNKGKKKEENKEMVGKKTDANKDDASNGENKGNNNDNDAKNTEGTSNEGYEDLRLDKDGQEKSTPQSYQNLSYGLGDRKPSNGSQYATIADKRPSQDGGHQYVNIRDGSKEQSQQGSPAISGAAAGSLAGSMVDGNNRSGQTPAIVTSPAPADSGTPTYDNVNGTSLGDRGGSPSKSGTPVSSRRPSSGNNLNNIDDEQLRERRRSSIHSLVDDGAEPLKHKTATVGIVGLALRNKNERKKETEFKNLDKEMPALGSYPASTAGKNRFPEILPNPRSRVKLTSSPDYINASYLHDHKGQRHYIATQHPLVETKDDFWQMAWDQDSHLIVMVNDDENSKQIDYPNYWPTAEGNSMEHNGIVVTNKQTVTKADYVITTLVITNNKVTSSISREIIHYRYTSWKDKDQMPNVAMFVGFVVATREIGKKYEDGKSPVIVHCSDGQGFTGVFIALDIGIRSHEESKTSVVDLFELAKRLRQGRSCIINSLQLYNFAYQCLYEYTVNYDEEAEKKKDA